MTVKTTLKDCYSEADLLDRSAQFTARPLQGLERASNGLRCLITKLAT